MKLVCFDRKFYDFVCFVGVFRFKLSSIKPEITYLRSTDPMSKDRPIRSLDRPLHVSWIDRSYT